MPVPLRGVGHGDETLSSGRHPIKARLTPSVVSPYYCSPPVERPTSYNLSMRLFLAIHLPPAFQDVLAAVGEAARANGSANRLDTANWISCDQLHLTLKFLGDVTPPNEATLIQHLTAIQPVGPIELKLAGPVLFPVHGPIRIVGVALARDERLVQLQAELEMIGEALGVPRERRPFRPHITLARSRRGLPASLHRAARDGELPGVGPVPEATFVATEFTLTESCLSPTGAKYTARQAFVL